MQSSTCQTGFAEIITNSIIALPQRIVIVHTEGNANKHQPQHNTVIAYSWGNATTICIKDQHTQLSSNTNVTQNKTYLNIVQPGVSESSSAVAVGVALLRVANLHHARVAPRHVSGLEPLPVRISRLLFIYTINFLASLLRLAESPSSPPKASSSRETASALGGVCSTNWDAVCT